MSEVVVIARAKAQPGREEEMAQALRANAETSRSEDGCVSYSVLRGDEGLFMTVERWATRGHVQTHMATPHVQSLLATITPMLAAPPDIQVLEEV
jgi:quinol monooxygenase YgiN